MKIWSALRVLFLLVLLAAGRLLSAQLVGIAGPIGPPVVSPPLSMPQPPAQQQASNDSETGQNLRSDSIFIPTISGQPFFARIQIESVTQLAGGTTVAQKTRTVAARSTKGQVYREAHELIPADSERDPAVMRNMVFDPADKSVTTCYPERRSCRHESHSLAPPTEEPEGTSADGTYTLQRERLGKKTMVGLEVEGMRETRTYAAGVFGNDKPVVVVREHWYSPLLQCDLRIERTDPRNGTLKIQITEVKLGEPAADWFRAPDNYRMFEGVSSVAAPMYPKAMAPLLEKDLKNLSQDELENDLKPVDEALAALANAHAAAAPKDRNEAYAGQMRQRLAMDFRRLQQMQASMPHFQDEQANARLNQAYREILASPCLSKTAPGDPPFMVVSADGLRDEQQAWLALRDAWVAFLNKMFPHAGPSSPVTFMVNERTQELRRMQNVLRNRGCQPAVSLESIVEPYLGSMTADQLATALKPVDEALQAYMVLHR